MRPGPPPMAGRRQDIALGFTAITGGVVYAASATTIFGTDVTTGRPVFELAMPAPSELGTVRLVAQGDVLFVVANEQTTSVQPADGSLFYENQQLLVKLVP